MVLESKAIVVMEAPAKRTGAGKLGMGFYQLFEVSILVLVDAPRE